MAKGIFAFYFSFYSWKPSLPSQLRRDEPLTKRYLDLFKYVLWWISYAWDNLVIFSWNINLLFNKALDVWKPHIRAWEALCTVPRGDRTSLSAISLDVSCSFSTRCNTCGFRCGCLLSVPLAILFFFIIFSLLSKNASLFSFFFVFSISIFILLMFDSSFWSFYKKNICF